eukprot:g12714.t2
MVSTQTTPDVMAYTAIIHCSAKKGNVEEATRWFQRMSLNDLKGDAVTFTALINACAKRSDAPGALGWLRRLVDEQLQPNVVAFSAALKAGDVPKPCWKTTVLRDTRLGWAGQCENLFQLDKLDSARLCQKACTEDPRCPVWQFRQGSQTCWVGFGVRCDGPGAAASATPAALSAEEVLAQRLLHGTVYVVRELACARSAKSDEASSLWQAMESQLVAPNIIAVTSAIEVCAKSRPRRTVEAEELFRRWMRNSSARPDTKLMRR